MMNYFVMGYLAVGSDALDLQAVVSDALDLTDAYWGTGRPTLADAKADCDARGMDLPIIMNE